MWSKRDSGSIASRSTCRWATSNALAARFAVTSNRRSNQLLERSSKRLMPDCGFDSPRSRQASIEPVWSRTFPGAVFQSRGPRGACRSAAASGRSAFGHWGVRRSPMRRSMRAAPASSKRSAKGSGELTWRASLLRSGRTGVFVEAEVAGFVIGRPCSSPGRRALCRLSPRRGTRHRRPDRGDQAVDDTASHSRLKRARSTNDFCVPTPVVESAA